MNELPRGTVLGDLSIVQVIEYYDFPRLFTCRSVTGQFYIGLSTYDDESESHWLYLPVSTLRLNAVTSAGISLFQAFQEPESGYVVRLVLFNEPARHELTYVFPEQIKAEDLPSPSYAISTSNFQVAEEGSVPPKQVAAATRRETFDYHIYPGRKDAHEVPSRKLGAILTTTQELVDALGQAALGQATVRGPIPAELLLQTKMNVANVFQGSFGVQFRATQFSDLLDQSTLCAALQQFAYLLEAEDSEDLLSNKLHELKGRVASKYRRLLKELADLDSGLVLDWGSVKAESGGQFRLSLQQVKNAYAIVDRIDIAMAQEMTITGKLIGFNLRTQRYEILSSDDGKTYAGKVSNDADLSIANPSIGQFYEADLRMLVETQSTSGDELVRWVLVRLGSTGKSDGA